VKYSRGNLIFQLCTADPPDHGTITRTTASSNSVIATTTSRKHVAQIAEGGFHIELELDSVIQH